MIRRLVYLAQLGRVGMAPVTISVPILGAFTLGAPLTSLEIFGLGGIGLCAHLFGFALNDLIDQPLDRTVPIRQGHPLVSGRLSQLEVWVFTLIQVPLALGVYYFTGGHGAGLGILCLSVGLSAVYNLGSKRGPLPRFLAEAALAISVGLLCSSGALLKSAQLLPSSIAFSLTLTLVLLLLNSVPSGLKDLKTDSAYGAVSFVQTVGSRMLDADRMFISRELRLYSAILQGAISIGLLYLLALLHPGWLVGVLTCILALYAALHLRLILSLRSFTALRRSLPLLNGYYNYAALALVVIIPMPLMLKALYALLVLALLLIPWQLSWRMWRNRHRT